MVLVSNLDSEKYDDHRTGFSLKSSFTIILCTQNIPLLYIFLDATGQALTHTLKLQFAWLKLYLHILIYSFFCLTLLNMALLYFLFCLTWLVLWYNTRGNPWVLVEYNLQNTSAVDRCCLTERSSVSHAIFVNQNFAALPSVFRTEHQ